MSITYVESVLTLASCKEGYDEMTKEEFARKVVSILLEEGHFVDPEDNNG